MSEWKSFRLDELCSGITDGKHGDCQDEPESGYYFISAKDVYNGNINYSNARQIKQVDFEETHRRTRLAPNDIVITNSGSIGRMALITDSDLASKTTFQKSVAIIKPISEVISPKFLYYSLLFRRDALEDASGGTAQKNLLLGALRRFQITAPTLPEQIKIAEMLSAYDDLIINNRRRIALLEDAGRQLYNEWFVRLRFPGAEHTPIVDGVPQGWERLPFSDVANFVNGYPFKPEELSEYGLPVVKIPELRDGVTDKTPYNDGENIPDKYFLTDGSLLFSWSGTLLVNFWHGGKAILNQHLFRVDRKLGCSPVFLLLALREALPTFMNETTGATLKHIRKSALTTVTTLVPPSILMTQFDDVVEPIYNQVQNLQQQNEKLKTARDLLLPHLMNGG